MTPPSPTKFGIAAHPSSPRTAITQARLAEALGLDSFWVVDNVSASGTPDALTVLAGVAAATSQITLATGVTDVIRRDAAALAQAAATVDQISGGRLVLGLGAGFRANLAPYGRPCDQLLPRLAETVPILRDLWTGKAVTVERQFTHLQAAAVGATPVTGQVPISLGLTSSLGLELVGRLGDGWYPLGQTPESYAQHLHDVHAAAAGAGRDPQSVEPCLLTFLDADADADAARRRTLGYARSYLLYVPGTLRVHGVEPPRGMRSPAQWSGEEAQYRDLMPAALALSTALVGTPDECAGQLQRFVESGVSHFVFSTANHRGDEALTSFQKSWDRLTSALGLR